jgi:hypothetical protein
MTLFDVKKTNLLWPKIKNLNLFLFYKRSDICRGTPTYEFHQ